VLAYVAHFVFLRDVWILTQRHNVASRRATNLATHLPYKNIIPSPSPLLYFAKIHIFNDLTVVLLLVYLLLGRNEVSVVKVLA
jgi:hypothetical protein